ncbi:MAG: DUF882 domain-containing protein [Deltaproteobacteria bacterium]|nr:DUF882 domain-containing protein [Deltaproteobacteria bacterium]
MKSILAFALFVLLLCPPSMAETPTTTDLASPFFLMGDGRLKLKNIKNGLVADVKLVTDDLTLNDSAFDKIDQVFGFPTKAKGEHISQRMLFMLDYFSDLAAKGKTIHIKSGYRSPTHNQSLRDQGKTAAKTSTHVDGMALDFYITGVDGKEMWELIRSKDCCGAGNYGGNTVHLDSGRPRFWQKETSKVWTGESDFNRNIYLSTDYDKYRQGATVRMFFTSISDFGFGVKKRVFFVTDTEGNAVVAKTMINTTSGTECLPVTTRDEARFIYAEIPPDLEPGFYRIKIDFCQRPSEEMPESRVSNLIEIVAE